MFFTGVFSLEGACCQKVHNSQDYDDDVVSWFPSEEGEKDLYSDGYVTNKGRVAIIYILPEHMNEEDIETVKKMFVLYEEDGISELRIAEFTGWDMLLQGASDAETNMSEQRTINTNLLNDLDFSAESIDKAMNEFKAKKKGDGKRGPFYNGSVDNPWIFDIDNRQLFQNAVWQGYLDASRTFSGIAQVGKTKENPLAFHHLAGSIQRYFKKDKIEFIHTVWCIDFMDAVREINHYSMRYGQAQKVVNMAFKYLYCCDGAHEYMDRFNRCHMPLDQFTLAWLFLQTGTLYQEWSWFDEKTYNEVAGTIKDILGKNILGKEMVIWQRFSDKNNPVLINLKQNNEY